MKCRKCSHAIKMVAEPPGWFLGAAITCLLISLPAAAISPIITMGLWVAAVPCFFALISNIWDNKSMAKDGRAEKGLECKHCGEINRVYPWTL